MGRIKPHGKVFRDPVHQLIRIGPEDEFILALIDTPEFQRLRRIRQLGVSWLTFHGAEHSRFVHSLGVFNFAQRIIHSLRKRYGANHEVTDVLRTNKRIIKAAALLHDIGHAPFSHMLERAFGKKHHEERTCELIGDETSGINQVLRQYQVEPEHVASVIRKDFPDKLVVDIVSSQLDADRMDYLLRDSHCTGVGYGEYDPEWLLHSLCASRVAGARSDGQLALCLDRSRGVYAAERLIVARLHMYQQVYMHRATRGFEVLLLNLFSAAAHCVKETGLPQATPPLTATFFALEGKINSAQFLMFDESQIVSALHVWASAKDPQFETIRRLSLAFLNRERVYAGVDLPPDPTFMLKLGVKLAALPKEEDGQTPTHGIDSIEDTPYKGMLYRARKRGVGEENINESILISDPEQPDSAQPVEMVSTMLEEMDAQKFAVTRLYFDRRFRSEIERIVPELSSQL